jgi:FixJ family two-component response regulator
MPAVNPPESTVFIVDDDPSVREALTSLIRSAGLRAAAFASGRDFLRQQPLAFPACLLLDIRLPEMGGFDLQQALLQAGEDIPVIFITGHGDIPMSVRAMKAGAIDFLTKPFRDDELLATIRHALQWHHGARAEHQYAAEIQRRVGTLTKREREVMDQVVKGLLNKQIAARLGIAEITTKVHRRRVMQKMQAASLAELVRMGERLERTPYTQV